MDDSPIRYLVWIVVCVALSAFFSALETAFASVSRIRMKTRAEDGDRKAARVLKITGEFDRALTTLLILNDITNIGSAALTTVCAMKFWGANGVAAAAAVLTVVVFLFAEVIPKSFAKSCSEPFALATAGFFSFIIKLLRPLSALFAAIGRLLSSPVRKRGDQPTVTEDELHDIIETIVEEGEMDEDTGELVQSALDFSHRTGYDVMTPWEKADKLRTDMTGQQALDFVRATPRSRLPLVDMQGRLLGVVPVRRFLKKYFDSDGKVRLRELADKPHFVRGALPVDELLPAMSANKTHIAFIQRGAGVAGLLTIEDILEELVGEIYDEEDAMGGVTDAATD